MNLTKLRQLDLTWNADKCSADLQLSGPVVSKVSEAFGDYSTVLAAQGGWGWMIMCLGLKALKLFAQSDLLLQVDSA